MTERAGVARNDPGFFLPDRYRQGQTHDASKWSARMNREKEGWDIRPAHQPWNRGPGLKRLFWMYVVFWGVIGLLVWWQCS